jgi:hypothetical protein
MEEIIETQLARTYSNGLTGKEIIRRITEVYNAGYNFKDPDYDIYEQLLACESMAETEAEELREYGSTNEGVDASGNDYATCKRTLNSKLTERKHEIIKELTLCNYRTPIYKIASLLEELFKEWESKPYHWPRIAQYYPPRAINRVLHQMTKQHGENWATIENPSALFTCLIKFRPIRKTIQKKHTK